jgi:hypothetical protein
MGCAIIWSYIELFGDARLKAAVYVDQAGGEGGGGEVQQVCEPAAFDK